MKKVKEHDPTINLNDIADGQVVKSVIHIIQRKELPQSLSRAELSYRGRITSWTARHIDKAKKEGPRSLEELQKDYKDRMGHSTAEDIDKAMKLLRY